MLKLEPCPKCGEKRWKLWDWENNQSFADLEKGEYVPKGTQIRRIECAKCGYENTTYQKTK